jgi:hypothetical protein
MAEKGSAALPYGVVIQRAIATGELAEMKRVAQEADRYLQEWGDIRMALAALQTEIARAEQKG